MTSAPQKPAADCALCVSGEPEPTPIAPVAPSIGPLGCQGLVSWLVLSVPPMVMPAELTRDASRESTTMLIEASLKEQAHCALDPPPPRA